MKADYISRSFLRSFLGILDRWEYFNANKNDGASQAVSLRADRFFTRETLTQVINHILELECSERNYTELEAAVMKHPDAKAIFTSVKFSKKVVVDGKGSVKSGDACSKEEILNRQREFAKL